MPQFTESIVEEAALAWLAGLGYTVLHGPQIAVGEPGAERSDPGFRDVVLAGRLRAALARLNPTLPPEALEDAFRKLTRADAPTLLERNRLVHRMLVDGVTVEYRRPDGSIAGAQAAVLGFDRPGDNDWAAVNQLTVVEGQHNRRPDVVLYVNGLPLAVLELKNTAAEKASSSSAPSPDAGSCCASRRSRRRTAPICGRSCAWARAAWSSPPSRSSSPPAQGTAISSPRSAATATRFSPTAATSW